MLHTERVSHGRVGQDRYEWKGRWGDVDVTLSLVVVDGRTEVRGIALEAPSEVTRRRLRDIPLGELREDALGHLRRFEGLLEATRAGGNAHDVVAGADVPRPRPRTYGPEHYEAVWAAYGELGTVAAVARRYFVSRPTASRWVARARSANGHVGAVVDQRVDGPSGDARGRQ
jgi:hypothetical protein